MEHWCTIDGTLVYLMERGCTIDATSVQVIEFIFVGFLAISYQLSAIGYQLYFIHSHKINHYAHLELTFFVL